MPVKNQRGEDSGKIHDIVFDTQARVPFAVVSRGPIWGIGGKLVAIPFRAFTFDKMGKYLVLEISKEELDSAPSFNMKNLSNQKWAEGVERYFGQQPY